MVDLGNFLKPEACGQTVLPKFKRHILSNFQTLC